MKKIIFWVLYLAIYPCAVLATLVCPWKMIPLIKRRYALKQAAKSEPIASPSRSH